MLGAIAEGATVVRGFLASEDCLATQAALEAMGVAIERQRDGLVRIAGVGAHGLRAPSNILDLGNSGTAIRLLMGLLAGQSFDSKLTGDASLQQRPMERVAAPLRQMGARIATANGGRPPVAISGGSRLRGIDYQLPMASAQVKSALLLAALFADGETTIRSPGPSRDHTERMLPAFGVTVERAGLSATVRGGTRLRGAAVAVPGDASSAAFLVVAALVLPDSEVRLDGVLLSPTRTAFLEVLRAMGGHVEARLEATDPEPVGSIVASSSALRGTTVDPALVPSLIDEVPALAAAAAFAEGPFTVTGAGELRVKESDRIAALAQGLAALGARVRELPDGLVVEGGAPLLGARVQSHGDHRIAMALSVAALAASGETEVEGAECVAVSFPGFYALVDRATGRA